MATKIQQHDVTTETDVALSALVVNAVSAATETRVDELPPLCHAIDPDALDVLFSGSDAAGAVEFQYAGRTVTVFPDRTIEVSPAATSPGQPANTQIY